MTDVEISKAEEAKVEPKITMQEQLKNIDEKLSAIAPKIKAGKKVKEFSLPFKINFMKKAAVKKNKILVFYLQRNMGMKLFYAQPEEGRYEHDGKTYNANHTFIFLYRGKIPSIIQPEWSIDPINPYEIKDNITAQQIIIRAVEASFKKMMDGKKKFGSWGLILIVVGVGIVGYLIFSSFNKG